MSCHRHAVIRSQAKAKARKLLEEAAEHEKALAEEFGGHEWRRRKAADLRDEASKILGRAA